MKRLFSIILTICWLFAGYSPALAQTEPVTGKIPVLVPARYLARVDVIFDLPDKIKQPFASCVLSELGTIDDVILTRKNPQYRMTIMALPNKTREENIGFTFSVIVTQPIDMNILRPFLSSDKLSDDEKKILTVIGNNYEKIEKRSLLTCSPDELGGICKKIVSSFDADVLDVDRRMWNSTWNIPERTEEQILPEKE